MRKATIFIVAFVLAISFAIVAKASCSNKDLLPFLGKWVGGFEVQRVVEGPDSAKDRERSSLKGYIVIYATNRKFKIHLDGEQEGVDLGGDWTFKNNRVTLHVTDFAMDDQGGEDVRNPNMKFVPADQLRVGYSRPMVLDLSADKKSLVGLPITIGGLVGKHRFAKESLAG